MLNKYNNFRLVGTIFIQNTWSLPQQAIHALGWSELSIAIIDSQKTTRIVWTTSRQICIKVQILKEFWLPELTGRWFLTSDFVAWFTPHRQEDFILINDVVDFQASLYQVDNLFMLVELNVDVVYLNDLVATA